MRTLCIDDLPGSQRVAVLEDGHLEDFFLIDDTASPAAGDIYLARVLHVVDSIGAAFVALDDQHQGFLNRQDLPAHLLPNEQVRLSSILKPDRPLLVRIKKPPFQDKAASVSAVVQLPGLLTIFLPMESGIHFSRTFQGDRGELIEPLQAMTKAGQNGWLIRSVAAKTNPELVFAEARALVDRHAAITADAETGSPRRLYRDDPILACLRNQLKHGVRAIHTNHAGLAERLRQDLAPHQPELAFTVRYHEGIPTLFDLYRITPAIESLRKPKVWLKSGGWLKIDITEAMVVIDVNSGKDIHRGGKRSAALRANLEAANEIPRQLHLRDLAGLIVIDFIDARDQDWQKGVNRQLRKALRRDAAATDFVPINKFSVAHITREQRRPSLQAHWQHPCPTCRGAGWVDRATTIWMDVWDAMVRQLTGLDENQVTLWAGVALFDFLCNRPQWLADAVQRLQLKIELRKDPQLAAMRYRIEL